MYGINEAMVLAMAKARVANAMHDHGALSEWCRLECHAGKHDG